MKGFEARTGRAWLTNAAGRSDLATFGKSPPPEKDKFTFELVHGEEDTRTLHVKKGNEHIANIVFNKSARMSDDLMFEFKVLDRMQGEVALSGLNTTWRSWIGAWAKDELVKSEDGKKWWDSLPTKEKLARGVL